jgi:hypothetical protein
MLTFADDDLAHQGYRSGSGMLAKLTGRATCRVSGIGDIGAPKQVRLPLLVGRPAEALHRSARLSKSQLWVHIVSVSTANRLRSDSRQAGGGSLTRWGPSQYIVDSGHRDGPLANS